MDTARRCRMVAAVFALIEAISVVRAVHAGEKLAGYNALIGESSISGISSGGFMAVQFATAWSSVIKGVGVVAGGPYWCAKADSFFGYWTSVSNALGPCMKGPLPDLDAFFAKADAKSKSGAIDPLQFVGRQKVYLFHGYNDSVVARAATDAAASFYRRYLDEANRGNLYYQTAIGAGHSLVVAQDSESGLNNCNENKPPFIDTCRYDQAGIILQHIYGPLNKPGAEPLTGTMKPFDQSIYTKPDGPSGLSLGQTGYVFVPKACESGEACRVHIALHGCKQDVGDVGRVFIDRTGFNAWADANRLIVLYPQTAASSWYPYNPQACWDWWGYVSFNDNYVTKAGLQIKAVKAMLDTLTSRAQPATTAAAAPGPIALTILDTSDTAVDLAWTPQAGATGYRVRRAGPDGQFNVVANVTTTGFADSGLRPKSTYRWRVAPLTDGMEGAPSNEADAVTRAVPACSNPGSCPWGN